MKKSALSTFATDATVMVAVVAAAAYTLHRYTSVKSDLRDAISALNNTAFADQEGLVFNRVPKVGSEMIWSLIDRLAVRNGFNSFSDSKEVKDRRGAENTYLTTRAQRKEYADILLQNCTKPYSYVKHINFIDFTEFNMTQPIYINFVRDPVSRVISWYYYIRAPWRIISQDVRNNVTITRLHKRIPSVEDLKVSFEQCYIERRPECVYETGNSLYSSPYGGSHYSQISFYCGHEPECDKFGSEAALYMAKRNVERYFAVVGILELLDKSLEVLEHYVPRFFEGARDTHASMSHLRSRNKNIYQPKTPEWIKKELRANFTSEIEFFHFCRQRLHKQHLALTNS